jgi:hypothetical protein
VVIDTTGLPIDAVVQRVVDLVESRLGPTRNDPA